MNPKLIILVLVIKPEEGVQIIKSPVTPDDDGLVSANGVICGPDTFGKAIDLTKDLQYPVVQIIGDAAEEPILVDKLKEKATGTASKLTEVISSLDTVRKELLQKEIEIVDTSKGE